MSDDIDIRDGGVVAVDTQTLRAAAARCAALSARVRDARDGLGDAARRIDALGAIGGPVRTTAHEIQQSSWITDAQLDDLDAIAADLRAAADTYEVVELRARAAIRATPGRVAGAATALLAFGLRHPDAVARADEASAARDLEVGAALTDDDNLGTPAVGAMTAMVSPLAALALLGAAGALPEIAQGAQALIRRLHAGTIAPGSRLVPSGAAARVRRTATEADVASPDGLADALGRIPHDDARVRIETYTMPDGTMRYAVYLAGTREFSPLADGTDPWDMTSNLQMYFGQDSAAYEAVKAAMVDAGVPAGARVYLFGHSQGGLIADWLAVQGEYEVPLLVTAGSPTEAAVGDETLSVQLRHTDDIVQSLAGGGSDARVGGEGSMVVERAGTPGAQLGDVTDAAHHLTAYVATAKMVDAAADPRATRMRSVLGELRGATSVTAVEYDATRVTPPAASKGEPTKRAAPSPSPVPSPAPPR